MMKFYSGLQDGPKKPGQCLFRASLGVLQSLKAKAADFRQVAPFCVIILTIAEFRIQQR